MAELSEKNKECYCGTKGFEDLGYCTQIVAGTIFSYTASLLTAIVNIMLASVIRRTGKWQMWNSRSSEASGSMVATFFTQFCNSAVILVLVNLDWSKVSGERSELRTKSEARRGGGSYYNLLPVSIRAASDELNENKYKCVAPRCSSLV